MILNEDVNKTIGLLISIVNGLSDNIESIEELFRISLKTIKYEYNLDKIIGLLELERKRVLSDCIHCMSPCGKADIFNINLSENKDNRIKMLNDFLSSYSDDMALDVIAYNLSKLSW